MEEAGIFHLKQIKTTKLNSPEGEYMRRKGLVPGPGKVRENDPKTLPEWVPKASKSDSFGTLEAPGAPFVHRSVKRGGQGEPKGTQRANRESD